VGLSNGSTAFNTTLWTTWNPNVTWVDVQVGDFNGDGQADIVGRVLQSGQWWVGLSNGSTAFNTTLWANWNPSVTWVDVQVGDFNGDGKADIAGRVSPSGQWWAGISNGSSTFNPALWTTWNPSVTWVDVHAGDVA
jgi:FG-GAP repeat